MGDCEDFQLDLGFLPAIQCVHEIKNLNREADMPVIRKWGNSLALRIPSNIASQLKFGENSTVEFTVLNGNLVVKPVERKPRFLLSELISAINEENIHKEIETGPPVGGETW